MLDDFQRAPLNRSERIMYAIMMVVMIGLFACEIIVNYQPRKLAAVFFLISWTALVAIHELGHALMAWLCGWGVRRIVVGFGREIGRCNLWGVPMEWRMFPISGFVQTAPLDLRSPRNKDALIYAAGPGIELVLAAMLTIALGWSTMFTQTDHLGILFVQSFACAAVMGAVLNLIPMSTMSEGQWIPNDGLGIIHALKRTDSDYRELYAGD